MLRWNHLTATVCHCSNTELVHDRTVFCDSHQICVGRLSEMFVPAAAHASSDLEERRHWLGKLKEERHATEKKRANKTHAKERLEQRIAQRRQRQEKQGD
eukprot:SAG31_NODE_32162_length_359_cov_0.796154_1_plen_99_part_01